VNAVRIAAIGLVVAGVLGLSYGAFTYTQDTHSAKIGDLELKVKDRKTVQVPAWAGLGLLVAGVALLVFPRRRA